MNLYVVSSDTQECAEILDDLRLVKSCFDAAYALSAAASFMFHTQRVWNVQNPNHPVCLWVRSHPQHFVWTADLYFKLNREHIYRNNYEHTTHRAPMLDVVNRSLARISKQMAAITIPEYFLNHAKNTGKRIDLTRLPTFEAYKEYLRRVWRDEYQTVMWTGRVKPRWARVDISR